MTEEANDLESRVVLRNLGERIRQLRRERGLSVRDIVQQHNYHDSQWRKYEAGGSLTVPSLVRIAKALGTSLSILLDGIGEYSTDKVETLKSKRPGQEKAVPRKNPVGTRSKA